MPARTLNVHLGPADEGAFLTKQLSAGMNAKLEAFRTEDMQPDHYVARLIQFDDQKVELRDATLHPQWAGQPVGGRGTGRTSGQGWGRGYGRGRGAGWSRQGGGWGRQGGSFRGGGGRWQ